MAASVSPRAAIGGIVLLAVAGALGGWWLSASDDGDLRPRTSRTEDRDGRPNVLFIVWDTTRADRMSLYGNARPTTPRIDAYAKDAVVYERAYSPDMWTMPSHAAMFTGLPTASHGVNTDWRWLDAHYTTLPELFSAAGWDTYGFTANQFASPQNNIFQGMDEFDTAWQGPAGKASKQATREKLVPRDASTEISPAWVPDRSEPNLIWERGLAKDAAPVAHEGVIRFIERRPDPEKPWFAFINMMEAHWPRVPTMKARKQVLDPATLEKGLVTDATLWTALSYNLGRHEYTPEEIAAQVGVYDAALVDLDDAT
ncbi:MAG: sulfatase-like hydrolase/transferase, partial [Deltaproteobacteria bacterium]|nr:sulfatase-like hydrolase/transferase [Deltaproteobacteria bacterium]